MQQPLPPLNGFYLVNKPVGPSSAAVTNRLKWLLIQAGYPKKGTGRLTIGHGGTLDPLADGLLPIGIGKATKQLQNLLEGPKIYTFTLTFGTQTTTDDLEGEPMATSPHRPTEAQITAILPSFTGPITQTPPNFSAIQIGGKRAYTMARAGESFTLEPRQITIHSLKLLKFSPEAAFLEATVSKGTYIRTLAKDLALALGTVGHVTTLTRTQHGPFKLEDAIPYQTLDKTLQSGDMHTYFLPLAVPPGQDA